MNLRKFTLALCLLGVSISSYSQNPKEMNHLTTSYDKSWAKVEQHINDDLPKSAISEAEKILKKATSEGNFAQAARAGFTLMAMRGNISPDSMVVDVEKLENLIQQREATADTPRARAELALLHALAATVYDTWRYSSLTLSDEEAEQLGEQRKAKHIEASTAHASDIAGVSVKDCRPLMEEEGKDSRFFGDDALSMVVDLLERESLVDDEARWNVLRMAASTYREKGMREAYALMRMRELEAQSDLSSYSHRLRRDDHVRELRQLCDEVGDTEVGADVWCEWLDEREHTTWQEELELVREGIARWPKSDMQARLKKREADCLEPSLNVYTKAQDNSGREVAGKPLMVQVAHRNIDDAEIVVKRLRVKSAKSKDVRDNFLCNMELDKMADGETVWEQHLSFDAHKQHPERAEEHQRDTLSLSLPAGVYRIWLRGGGKESKAEFQLNSTQVMTFSMPGPRRLATVVDALTGAPVEGCEVVGVWRKYIDGQWRSYSKSYVTDGVGQVSLDADIEYVVARRSADDESMEMGVDGMVKNYTQHEREQTIYQAFTDRAIYRPGQTVQVSGFVYTRLGEECHAVGRGSKVEVLLRDANWQVVQKTTVTTDDLGNASTDFVLPTDRLNGVWHIGFGGTTREFRVEEYKRPTFTLEMEDTEGSFALGDTIEMTGVARTYSGVPVQSAKVEFTVSQAKSTSWFWWYDRDTWRKMESGETTTDDEGRFRVRVFLDDDLVLGSDDMDADVRKVGDRYVVSDFRGVMQYRLEAKVTDLAGETHEAESTVRVSSREFGLNIDMDALVDRDGTKGAEAQVSALNAQGQKVAASGTWTLRKYNALTGKYDTDVAAGTFATDRPLTLPPTTAYELGSYELVTTARDTRQHDITASRRFVLWGSRRGGAMNLANDWIHTSSTTMRAGESVDVWFAVQHPDAHTYLYVVDCHQTVIEKVAVLQPTQQHLSIPYKEAYGQSLRFFIAYVKDGRQHQMNEIFTLARPDKELKLEWTTFRDRLTPGQQETWTLRVTDKQGRPVKASVLATMYDASLDAFVRHALPFALSFRRDQASFYTALSSIGSVSSVGILFRSESPKLYARAFNRLRPYDYYDDTYGSSYRVEMLGAAAGGRALMKSRLVGDDAVAMMAVEESVATNELNDKNAEVPNVTKSQSQSHKSPQEEGAPTPLRENFQETAFFQPHLMTDDQGSVSLSFTLPDCLTEWRVLSLAHTADIDYGHLESSVVARKQFMVQPGMPRFVRQGDHMTIATKVINTSERDLGGACHFRLVNPETGETVFSQAQNFSVGAGKTTSVAFDYDVPDTIPMLVCEVSGTAEGFSDGERNYLPVLSSRKYITETIPFYLEGSETKTLDLQPLFNQHSATATQRRMTFEYTDNPSWQAILALHAVILPENDDMVSWSASLYANRVAQSIARRMPRLLELIMRWNAEEGQETTLTSELEKNQELREILLQESPWMLEAQDETRQRQMLCELFDQRLLDRRIAAARQKLAERQFSDGGWSWFKGMEPSYYITLAVSEHMANLLGYLRSQGEEDKDVLAMLRKSIRYLDRQELNYYNKYGKKDKRSLPSESTFRYLYLRTRVPEALKHDADIAAMKKFYLDKVQRRVADLSIYGRANVAVILYDDHRDAYARRFVQSLHEYTVTRPGMGRYFDTDKAHYSWCDYRIPTHLAAMRSFMTCLERESGEDLPDNLTKDDLLQMQTWLLRQKQTQKWDNVLNTLDVADLLLTLDPATTFHEPELPKVTFAGQPLEISGQTAAVGYSKTPVPAGLIDAATATVTKHTPGISWGCIYGQSLESLDRLQATEGELRIDRKAYIQREGTWQPLDEGTPLHVGDKLRIRHIVTSDRDMDFVQVRSQHAACLEPLRQTSGYQWMGGRGAYLAMHDASADLFFDRFRKGTATLDLDFYVTRAGRYSLGVATIQCAYTPAFSGHSAGRTVVVE